MREVALCPGMSPLESAVGVVVGCVQLWAVVRKYLVVWQVPSEVVCPFEGGHKVVERFHNCIWGNCGLSNAFVFKVNGVR